MQPSLIAHIFPMGSVLQNWDAERVAKNIMIILERTGDKFRPLPWDEYRAERIKDGGNPDSEESIFYDVSPWCETPQTAQRFCEEWNRQLIP